MMLRILLYERVSEGLRPRHEEACRGTGSRSQQHGQNASRCTPRERHLLACLPVCCLPAWLVRGHAAEIAIPNNLPSIAVPP